MGRVLVALSPVSCRLMAKLSLTSLGPGLVAGLQSLSRKEYLSCEEGDALVAAALCRQLGERSFVLVVDHSCAVGSGLVCSYTAGSCSLR